MKRKFLYTALSVLLISVTVSCNNKNEEINDGVIVDGKVSATKGIQFGLSLSDYDEEQNVEGSRAIASDTVHKESIDLGNGMSAEVTVQRDRTKSPATTRVMPNGNYTMLAYDASKNLKGTLTGTVVGGVFTPTSANKDIYLEPGAYEFVCYNDKVTRNGNDLIVTRANAEGALIGREAKTITATPQKQTVIFDMRRVASRIRIQLTGWMDFPALSASLESTNSTSVAVSGIYNAALDTWTKGAGGPVSENLTFPASPTTPSPQNEFKSICNEYLYFTPQLDISNLKLTLKSGQIYKLPMNGASLVLKTLTDGYGNPTTTSPQTAYLINVKLTYNFLYLMSDGSTGFITETTFGNGAKTPIGVVVSQSKRMAVALQNGDGWNTCQWSGYSNVQTCKSMKYNGADLFTMEDGYHETWDASASVDNVTVKGLSSSFPAFKIAGSYTPALPTGVFISGTMIGKKWYLAASGEWKYVCNALGFGNADGSIYVNWYKGLAELAFTQVGGSPISGDYWTSSELLYQYAGQIYTNSPSSMIWGNGYKWDAASSRVRPFVRY